MTNNMRNGIAMGICSSNEDDRLRAYKLFFYLYNDDNYTLEDLNFKEELLYCISNESLYVKRNLLTLGEQDIMILKMFLIVQRKI